MLLERTATTTDGTGGTGGTVGAAQWHLRCLANYAAGRPVSYANDLDIAADGRIYFSDSSIIPPQLNEAAPRPW